MIEKGGYLPTFFAFTIRSAIAMKMKTILACKNIE
jgi:hypothetical protein